MYGQEKSRGVNREIINKDNSGETPTSARKHIVYRSYARWSG